MGFWNSVGSAVVSGVKATKKLHDEAMEYAERYEMMGLSEEEMRERARNTSSTAEKMGIFRALRNMGYIKDK